jgi:bifunctional non-homologous end joining protein LigD
VITHPEKILFPGEDITKGEIAAYYERVAPLMVPHLRGRPVTMERYPSGIQNTGFMHKDVSRGFPDWLERIAVPKKDGVVHYPLANDVRSLLWMANQNCITPHVWASRVPALHLPDLCVFDLDPMKDDAEVLKYAALGLRDLLDELGLLSWIKTSGSKGFHILVALDGSQRMGQVGHFAQRVGAEMVRRQPATLTQEFSKADRGGRILVDTGRNGFGATFAAVYAVRARPGAPVSAPCTWQEVSSGSVSPQSFNVRNIEARLADVGDLWSDMTRCSLDVAEQRLNAMS